MFELNEELTCEVEMARASAGSPQTSRLAMDCLDYTSLTGKESDQKIVDLCHGAMRHDLGSVCIYPPYIKTASEVIGERNVNIATVINFPSGSKRSLSDDAATPETTAKDVSRAIAVGAGQVDIVLDHEAFRAGNLEDTRALLEACRAATSKGVTMMVILETASFESADDLHRACQMAIEAGTDFLKTSTGFHDNGGATLEAAAILMDEAAKAQHQVGVKISGGVKTPDDCAQYMALAHSIMGPGAVKFDTFRIGASSLLGPLLESVGLDARGGDCGPKLACDY